MGSASKGPHHHYSGDSARPPRPPSLQKRHSCCQRHAEQSAAAVLDAGEGVQWEFADLAEAEEAFFYTMAEVRALRRRDCNGQACGKSGCFSGAMRKGAAWNPKLDCEGKEALAAWVTRARKNIGGIALAAHGPMQLNAAMAVMERDGQDYVLQGRHALGPCHILLGVFCRRGWTSGSTRAGCEGCEWARSSATCSGCLVAKAIECTPPCSTTRCGTRSRATRQQGKRRRGAGVEFVMVVGSIAPFYPHAVQQWGREGHHSGPRLLQRGGRPRVRPRSGSARASPGSRSLTEEEERRTRRRTSRRMSSRPHRQRRRGQSQTIPSWTRRSTPQRQSRQSAMQPCQRKRSREGKSPSRKCPRILRGGRHSRDRMQRLVSLAGAGWAEPSPVGMSPAAAESPEEAIVRAVVRAEDALTKYILCDTAQDEGRRSGTDAEGGDTTWGPGDGAAGCPGRRCNEGHGRNA